MLSILIEAPFILSRIKIQTTFLINESQWISLYTAGENELLFNNTIFRIIYHVALVSRNCVLLIIVVIFNIALIKTLKDYYRRQLRISNINERSDQIIHITKQDRNNAIHAIIVSSLAIIIHFNLISVFFIFLLAELDAVSLNITIYICSLSLNLLLSMKHLFNFYILLALNKKFRSNVRSLLPSWMFKRLKICDLFSCVISNTELINMETISTQL